MPNNTELIFNNSVWFILPSIFQLIVYKCLLFVEIVTITNPSYIGLQRNIYHFEWLVNIELAIEVKRRRKIN